jgi:hypothetical protein
MNQCMTRRRMGAITLGAAASWLAGCGGGATDEPTPEASAAEALQSASALPPSASAVKPSSTTRPLRLTPSGRLLKGPDGQAVILHGANLRDNLTASGDSRAILTREEADDLAINLSFNFVRLRLSHEGANLDDDHESGLTQAARTTLNDAIELLRERRVWMLLEMRTDDDTANSATLYRPGTVPFNRYCKTWTWLAKTYRNTDYIAGYGLLAEPSPDKDKSVDDPVSLLIQFQSALMAAISVHDAVTPFFIGPAFNYDTMGYRWNDYYTHRLLAPFRKRLVYEVNMLSPKPWISDGTGPGGTSPGDWPQPSVDDFSPLLTVAPGEDLVPGRDDERIFTRRSKENANFHMLMASNYAQWYLGFANAFAMAHQVPMVVDQFGASTLVNTTARPWQQLNYEQELIRTALRMGMGWSRWVYSANPLDRSIAGNTDVHQFYRAIGATLPGP